MPLEVVDLEGFLALGMVHLLVELTNPGEHGMKHESASVMVFVTASIRSPGLWFSEISCLWSCSWT